MYKKARFLLALVHQWIMYAAIMMLPYASTHIPLWRLVLLLVPVTITWFFMPRCKQMWQFFLLHGAMFVFPFLWTICAEELIFTFLFLLLLTFLHFLEQRPNGSNFISLPMPWAAAIFLVILLLDTRWAYGSIVKPLMPLVGAELIVFFFYLFLDHMGKFVELHRDNADMPLRQMERVNHGMLIAFLVILAIVIAILLLSQATQIFDWIGNALESALRWIFSKFPAPNLEPDISVDQMTEMEFAAYQQSSYNRLIAFLFYLFFVVLLIAVTGFVIFLLIRFLRSRLERVTDDSDKKESLLPERQTITKAARAGQEKVSWHDFSPSGQIRRFYIRTLRKAGKKKPFAASYTPTELEDAAGLSHDEHQTLHELYEKARYSKDGCTKEEWNTLRRKN